LDKEAKGKKSLLVIKTLTPGETKQTGFPNGIEKDVVFMELNKPILENLLAVCQVSSDRPFLISRATKVDSGAQF
jgi:hypothetical protein